jgi:hypothetical protein
LDNLKAIAPSNVAGGQGGTPDVLGTALIDGQPFPHSLTYKFPHGITGPQTGFVGATDYQLDKHYQLFETTVGFDGAAGHTMRFQAEIDGKRILLELVRPGKSVHVLCDVRGGSRLRLMMQVADLINYVNDTTVVWGTAKIVGTSPSQPDTPPAIPTQGACSTL